MNDKPDCYGSISLGDNSPCFQCGLRALCTAQKTRKDKFGILLWPRLHHKGLETIGIAELKAMSVKDDTVIKELREAFNGLGLRGSRKVFQYSNVSFLKVTEANFARIIIEFPTTPLEIFGHAPSSDKATKVLPLGPKRALTSSKEIREFRDRASGCSAHFTSTADAVTLVSELLRSLKDQIGSHE